MRRWLRQLFRRKPPEGSIGAVNREIAASIERARARLDDLDDALTAAAVRDARLTYND